MTLQNLLKTGQLREHEVTLEEVRALLDRAKGRVGIGFLTRFPFGCIFVLTL